MKAHFLLLFSDLKWGKLVTSVGSMLLSLVAVKPPRGESRVFVRPAQLCCAVT